MIAQPSGVGADRRFSHDVANILSKISKGSANSFSLCLTLKVTLFKKQNNVCRQGPFEIISYTDELLGNINGHQKANGGNKIHPEDSEIFVDF